MGDGLKQQWGVKDPAKPASDKQAKEFDAAFHKTVGCINGHLQYTSANAEAARHNPLEARRDGLYPAYQSAAAQIDPSDPAKAKGAIDKVLADAKALEGEVAKFRAEAEKAKNDWTPRQAKFDAAVHQVEELEVWGDVKAPPLRGLVDGIRAQVNDRRYAPACATLDQLLPKLKPIYDDYLKQKAAKPKYEQVLAEQSARLDPLKAAERPSQPMTTKAGEADTALEQAKGKADAKDFVGGLEQMKAVKTAIDELDKQAKDPQRAKFLTDSKTVEELLKARPADATFKTLEADWNALTQLRDQASSAADNGDYATGNKTLTDLKTKHTAYLKKLAELKKQKQAYDDALKAIQPRLTKASVCKYPKLQQMEMDMAAVQGQMETVAQSENYVEALNHVKDLSAKLDAYEKAVAEIEQQKKEYEAAAGALTTRVNDALKKQYLSLSAQITELKKIQADMAAAAQGNDYDKALQLTKDLSAKIDAYNALAAKQVEPAILGSAQNDRADAVLKKMSKDDQEAVQKLMDTAKSEPEKQFLLKGVAAGHSVKELQDFAKKIQGKNAKWMQDNLSLTGSSSGTGVKQQWKMSCNATTVEAVRGQMDPIYALKMHEDNPTLDQVDNADATKMNPKLAADQKSMLETGYSGAATIYKGGGVATSRGGTGGAGRWADDLLNGISDSTGTTYTTQKIGGTNTVANAVKTIDDGVSKGQPVPIVIGNSPTNYQHYVLVTGMEKGPPKRYTIHDPWTGTTVVRTDAQITSGALNVANCNQISAVEAPSTKVDK
jgi:hypothetical protein